MDMITGMNTRTIMDTREVMITITDTGTAMRTGTKARLNTQRAMTAMDTALIRTIMARTVMVTITSGFASSFRQRLPCNIGDYERPSITMSKRLLFESLPPLRLRRQTRLLALHQETPADAIP